MFKTLFFCIIISLISFNLGAQTAQTTRIPQFENEKVKVWQTIIYPSHKQTLSMHRHDHPRVVIALTDGVLKVTNQNGLSHDLILKKDKAYYLPADKVGEVHTDENTSGLSIKVMVIELK